MPRDKILLDNIHNQKKSTPLHDKTIIVNNLNISTSVNTTRWITEWIKATRRRKNEMHMNTKSLEAEQGALSDWFGWCS